MEKWWLELDQRFRVAENSGLVQAKDTWIPPSCLPRPHHTPCFLKMKMLSEVGVLLLGELGQL